jgi:hypothetical protein
MRHKDHYITFGIDPQEYLNLLKKEVGKTTHKDLYSTFIEIEIFKLHRTSEYPIQVYCHYCLEKGLKVIKSISCAEYYRENEKVNCKACSSTVRKETCLKKYGVEFAQQASLVKDKVEQTNIERYGVKAPAQNKEVFQKMKDTMLNTYGVENAGQSLEIQEKVKKTNLERYGAEHIWSSKQGRDSYKNTMLKIYGSDSPMKVDTIKRKQQNTILETYGVSNISMLQEVKDKKHKTNLNLYGSEEYLGSKKCIEDRTETLLRKYGVDHPMKIPGVSFRASKNAMRSKCEQGTVCSSKQQRYICNLFKGNLNTYIEDSNISLDITLEGNIAIEYDGSGHRMPIKLNGVSEQDFNRKEQKRSYFVLNQGWKLIRIISSKDLLPSDEVLLQMLSEAKTLFTTTERSWITYNLDTLEVAWKGLTRLYNYGTLKKVEV